MKTLVCGLPGSGKTTYCKEHLGKDGLCYDLDAIAAAFRLTEPHKEEHAQARALGNELLFAFFTHVDYYTKNVFIIRTAPKIEELKRINPDRVVICRNQYVERGTADKGDMLNRIREIEKHCMKFNIPVES